MKLFVAGLILVGMIVALLLGRSDTKRSARETALAQQVTTWQARYAQAVIDGTATVETLRVVERHVSRLRDTLNIHDTIAVKAFVYQTDTLRTYCLRCAARFDSLRGRSDSLIWSMQHEIAWWQGQHHPFCGRKCGIAIGLGAGLLGAVYINQTSRALR